MELFGIDIYDEPLEKIDVFNKGIINTINAYSFYLYNKDKAFKNAIDNSKIILPDGQSICLLAKLIHHEKLKKIAGTDFLIHALEVMNNCNGKVTFFGSCDKTLNGIRKRLNEDFPNIACQVLNPGFDKNIKPLSDQSHIRAINEFEPDILFVGLGAPKQEIWIHNNKSKLKAGTISGIGAAFSYFAGTKKRPDKFFIKLGLEGILRTMKEPKQQIHKDIKAYPYLINRVYKELTK